MPGINWRATKEMVRPPGHFIGGEGAAAAGMEDGDWRTQLPPGSRHRAVYRIMETLRWHYPISGHEDMRGVGKEAVVSEENIFNAATSQFDYLRRISLKILAWETKSRNPMATSVQSNAASDSRNPQYRSEVADAGMQGRDWRIRVRPESRQRIVNKMLEILKKHLPFPGEESVRELKNVSVRFEENVYNTATSQFEYLRKISLKMLRLEMEARIPRTNSLQSNAMSNSRRNPQDPGGASSTEVTHT